MRKAKDIERNDCPVAKYLYNDKNNETKKILIFLG